MYRAADVNPERAASSWLVHSAAVKVIDDESKLNGKLEKADAIVTDQPDTPLVMRYADCVPLLFYDPAKRAIGLAHAGLARHGQGYGSRYGTRAGIRLRQPAGRCAGAYRTRPSRGAIIK